ncbi:MULTISPECIES: hypothetical protein [unclassified Rhizobium]|uniref:hypothetical protein n=1 Tax=unclassified Rhizobium TaxID=2613769 RepID=UPI001A98641A|nr:MULTISPECIES: hypothetical protein [unclassified Rhizobium]MBX5161175.1 hypothetical protein [Rhizobium sp. NZLR8]MBX5167067.1 hypothetical protein [Rhizobium sp. NZLR4b]MBX5173050.1 hypothetical protein [Rhizobium sp. NZLR1b]MBX5185381.1 hypothetical protein [Rhizobium sp. NZLR5]MBX5190685.1 hypothetical protein [Rhizobium sp. NZLR3b]
MTLPSAPRSVILGLDPSIHTASIGSCGMDPRVKPENDEERSKHLAKLAPA